MTSSLKIKGLHSGLFGLEFNYNNNWYYGLPKQNFWFTWGHDMYTFPSVTIRKEYYKNVEWQQDFKVVDDTLYMEEYYPEFSKF